MPTLADYKAPYPEPTADQKRFVIFLDEKENEDELYKLEVIPGRVESVDGVNRHFMGGKMEEKTVEGWGYDYHVVTLGPTAGTRMMPLGPEAEKKPRFVASSARKIMRYNSKLPVVVYVPKDATVRYRIWTAQGGADGVAAEEH